MRGRGHGEHSRMTSNCHRKGQKRELWVPSPTIYYIILYYIIQKTLRTKDKAYFKAMNIATLGPNLPLSDLPNGHLIVMIITMLAICHASFRGPCMQSWRIFAGKGNPLNWQRCFKWSPISSAVKNMRWTAAIACESHDCFRSLDEDIS